MLKQRIWTALCLIPLVCLIIFLAPSWLYQIVLGVIFLATGREWLGLMVLPSRKTVWLWWFALIAVGWATTYLPLRVVLWGALVGWVVAAWVMLRFPQSGLWFRSSPWFRMLTGLWLLVPAWLALSWLRTLPHGAVWVLLLLLLVWGADTGGYFGGRFWGQHLLANRVSPKKTVEGALCGLMLALAVATVVIGWAQPGWLSQPLLWLVLLASILLSVIGDLTESLFKRIQGIKDSGNLLPGHGGLLDRIDSLLAAAPMFAIGLGLLMHL